MQKEYNKKNNKDLIIMGLIPLIMGIIILLFSINNIKNYNEKNITYIETTSIVVDYVYDNNGSKAIIVEYTVNGEKYRKNSTFYSNKPETKGTQIKIKYNPTNPQDIIWVNDTTNTIPPLIGTILIIIGAIIIIVNIKSIISKKENKTIQLNNPQNNNLITALQNDENQNQDTIYTKIDKFISSIEHNTIITSTLPIYYGIGIIIGGIAFTSFSLMFLFKGINTATKIIGIPFIICGIAIIIHGISQIIEGINVTKNTNEYSNETIDIDKIKKRHKFEQNIKSTANNMFIYGFLIFYFGLLIVIDIVAILTWSEGGINGFFVSIIFWIIGTYIVKNNIKKNK